MNQAKGIMSRISEVEGYKLISLEKEIKLWKQSAGFIIISTYLKANQVGKDLDLLCVAPRPGPVGKIYRKSGLS